jgi:hypothetical protein
MKPFFQQLHIIQNSGFIISDDEKASNKIFRDDNTRKYCLISLNYKKEDGTEESVLVCTVVSKNEVHNNRRTKTSESIKYFEVLKLGTYLNFFESLQTIIGLNDFKLFFLKIEGHMTFFDLLQRIRRFFGSSLGIDDAKHRPIEAFGKFYKISLSFSDPV